MPRINANVSNFVSEENRREFDNKYQIGMNIPKKEAKKFMGPSLAERVPFRLGDPVIVRCKINNIRGYYLGIYDGNKNGQLPKNQYLAILDETSVPFKAKNIFTIKKPKCQPKNLEIINKELELEKTLVVEKSNRISWSANNRLKIGQGNTTKEISVSDGDSIRNHIITNGANAPEEWRFLDIKITDCFYICFPES